MTYRLVFCLGVIFLAFGASGAVTHHIDGTRPNGGDCPTFGSWDAATDTCVIVDSLLSEGDWLLIESATVRVVGILTNEGLLQNHGTLIVDGFLNSTNDLVNFWTGTTVNRGQLFSHFMYNFGRLTNEVTGTIEFEFHLENNAPLTNHGHIDIGGTFINIPARTIENFGSMTIAPTGVLTNSGRLVHAGELDNGGTLQNEATLVEHCEGVFSGNPVEGQASTAAQAMYASRDSLEWCSIEDASGYDIVEGELTLLRSSGGDFSTATTLCTGNDLEELSLDHASEPAPGEGLWFLVRAEGVGGADFDSEFSSQTASRDAEIAASAAACP